MDASELPRAVAACRAVAIACGLRVDDALVVNDSNRLAVRIRPCDLLARVAPLARRGAAAFEVEVARRLADTDAPLATLDPRAGPRLVVQGDFVVSLWTYHEPLPGDVDPDEYADALQRLHAGMRQVDPTGGWLPHFSDRAAEALGLVEGPAISAPLADADRDLLVRILTTMPQAIAGRGAPEQLLHGEPHPGNLLRTRTGLLFIDLETCCRGPVEFDLAHAMTSGNGPPTEVAARYPGTDRSLVHDCWMLMLAMVTAWRFEPGDDLPNGPALATGWLHQLRAALES